MIFLIWSWDIASGNYSHIRDNDVQFWPIHILKNVKLHNLIAIQYRFRDVQFIYDKESKICHHTHLQHFSICLPAFELFSRVESKEP